MRRHAVSPFILASSLASLVASGCFFELADPVPASDGSRDGGLGGSTGGGGAGGGSNDDCGVGTKRCADLCVAVDDPEYGCSESGCDPCPAETVCSGGRCVIESCPSGFGDCNGVARDGCEVNFDGLVAVPDAATEGPLQAPRVTVRLDGASDDWAEAGVPRYAATAVCATCGTQHPLPTPTAARVVPTPEDLIAAFRVGWDPSFLYVQFDVRDDSIVTTPVDPITDLGDAAFEDVVELLLDGNGTGGVLQTFFGADGTYENANMRQPPLPGDLTANLTRGRSCYSGEVRIAWSYLMARNDPVTGGEELGFTLGVSDWDVPEGDAGATAIRESQIFSNDPSDNYWFDSSGIGRLVLEP